MRKTILLSSILLLSAVWTLGQYDSPSNQSSGSQSSTNQTTIEGCLSGSDGNYTLTDHLSAYGRDGKAGQPCRPRYAIDRNEFDIERKRDRFERRSTKLHQWVCQFTADV